MVSSNQLVIAPATRRDLELFASMSGRSEAWVSYADNRRQRSDIWIWVARITDQLVGLVDLRVSWVGRESGGGSWIGRVRRAILAHNLPRPDQILQRRQFGSIHDLVIVDYTRYGDIGSALLNQCIEQMQQSAIETIVIDLNATDEAAQTLCTSLDFSIDRCLLTREVPEEAIPIDSAIREAELSDLPKLSTMMREELTSQLRQDRRLQLKEGIDWEKYVTKKLKAPNIIILVFEENGQLAGYTELWLETPGQGSIGEALRNLAGRRQGQADLTGAHVFIMDVFVEKAFRKQGVAVRLIWQAGRRCQQLGIKEVRAAVWASNEWWLALSRRTGWQALRAELSRSV